MINGDDLKAMRTQAGITQAQMASKLGCDRKTIINYELGVGEPKMGQLFKWLVICRVDIKPLTSQITKIREKIDSE
ncbi:XRE family transcriptional regulator [Pseudoalteromonas citrea]|uniref:XRE family transcriptional regulator n=1 Tax=Pseudoalteromonas citrea TaxID=43655 RepID=A0A5S3XLP8_9GAMM|nr:helix-turn-helix transcriptional regulator [Pseudoalteromonas citrea]TMP42275.1 XRE family transcriptional regulator [Pseudoalteromonas citrea]TMP55149.1 XRE family transcriptional regulator [Pseudoalteromonas citrea]